MICTMQTFMTVKEISHHGIQMVTIFGGYRHEIGRKRYSDDVDLVPEIAIGRIACRNKIELKNTIHKLNIHYVIERSSCMRRLLSERPPVETFRREFILKIRWQRCCMVGT